MKTLHVASVVLLVGLVGCDRINSLLGRADGGATAASGGAGGSQEPTGKGSSDLPSLTGFEGEIDLTMKSTTSPAPVPLNLLVKNDVVRADVPADLLGAKDVRGVTGGGKTWALLRVAEKKAFVVLDAQRQAVVIDLNQVGDQMKSYKHAMPGAPDTPSVDPPKVVKTGTKETVAGYACEDWDVVNADKSRLSLCVADKGASFLHLPITGIPTENLWALELLDGKHFPVRGVAFDRDRTETGRIEVTKIDKRSLDGSQFEVPAGYKQVTIEEMMRGLAGPLPPLPDVPPPTPHHGSHGPHHHGKK